MTIEELKKSIISAIESDLLTMQGIVDQHLTYIEQLLNEGYSLTKIISYLDLSVSHGHFKNLLHRARKKAVKSIVNIKNENKTEHKSTIDNKNQTLDISLWKSVFHTINENLVNDIVNSGFSLEDVKDWKKKHSLTTTIQLRKLLTQIKEK